ncbi:NUDIX hydrolase [Sporosarcina sp. Te-1]|uniref:NUDIX hydrolase n=1 Tax=Sporosarcina sp. Te-1 TaxID=2818390 RepID=UPI001A9DCBB4|nr:NUDIX domain-containing protein [Sporosarcina sp. Te-1]QTD39701.1 NUDIX domain-containing protein [Sporosarcina sp. Te-1]
MASISVDWYGHIVQLTWMRQLMPERDLITSVHAVCFHREQLLQVNLNDRGWDFPGGHIEKGETAEACVEREVQEEAYVTGTCQLLGAVKVNHEANPLWNESSPYPKVGYQLFYRMDITEFLPFAAEHESTERLLIRPDEVADYHKGWHEVYEAVMEEAKRHANRTYGPETSGN